MKNKFIKHLFIFIFSVILVFQLLLLFGVIPYKYTWGGRLKSREEATVMVSVSICVNVLFLGAILLKAGYLKWNIPALFLQIALWMIVIVFGLNTIGNLFAYEPLERYLATPVTLLLTILGFKIATEKS